MPQLPDQKGDTEFMILIRCNKNQIYLQVFWFASLYIFVKMYRSVSKLFLAPVFLLVVLLQAFFIKFSKSSLSLHTLKGARRQFKLA